MLRKRPEPQYGLTIFGSNKGNIANVGQAYEVNKDPQVEDNTLDYRTVANDLRRVAGKQKSTNKIAKGSFGPASMLMKAAKMQPIGSRK
jgi:hypothetical protein